MSDFLARLVERHWGQVATIQPRARSIFAPESDASSFQVVNDAAALQPGVDRQQEPSWRHAESEAKPQRPGPKQQSSQERSVSPLASLVHQTSAQIVFRPLVESGSSVEATTDNERRTPSSRWSESPLRIDRVLNISVEAQPTLRRDQTAKAKDTVDTQSLGETTLIPAPPLVEPRVQDPMPIQQQISAPAALRLAESATERPAHAQPRVTEPPVHVTIGRIEVTAVTAPPAPKRVPSSRKASMPLQDYLARRRGGQP